MKKATQPRLIKLPEVRTLTSLSRTEIYRRMAAGRFPKQIRLGSRSVAWSEAEIHQWIDQQMEAGA